MFHTRVLFWAIKCSFSVAAAELSDLDEPWNKTTYLKFHLRLRSGSSRASEIPIEWVESGLL